MHTKRLACALEKQCKTNLVVKRRVAFSSEVCAARIVTKLHVKTNERTNERTNATIRMSEKRREQQQQHQQNNTTNCKCVYLQQ